MMTKNKKTTSKTPLIKTNDLSKSTKVSMVTRIISAIVMLCILIPAIVIGNWIYFGLLTILLGIASYEILGCAHKRNVPMFIIFFIFVLLIAYWPMFKRLLDEPINTRVDQYFQVICLPLMMTVIGIFVLFAFTIFYKDFTVKDACFLVTMGLLIGFGFQCLLYLRFAPTTYPFIPRGEQFDPLDFRFETTLKPAILLIFVICSTFITDVGAYFVGILFGKTKMNERISPNKTWEGFVGGIVVCFVVSFTTAMILSATGFPLIPGVTAEKWYLNLVFCIMLPLVATLGDFVFSSIKRSYGIKDYGKLIPGHGGILDRFDSIIFSSIISAIMVFIIANAISGNYVNVADLLI